MNEILNRTTVLVLNRNWQAIHTRTPADAFCQMATNTATALDIEGDSMIPVKWRDWISLPVREQDQSIQTVRGPIRIPTVLVLGTFAKVPKRRPNLSAKSIWQRDGGICQYTGRQLRPHEGNIDHVIPRSRGGGTTWENCVLADKKVNTRKGSRLPHEAGLSLRRKPQPPKEIPVTFLIQNAHGIRDWNRFLDRQ